MSKLLFSIKGIATIAAVSALCFTGISYASGGYGGGYEVQRSQADIQYDKGKSVFRKKLKCSKCELGKAKVNRATAPDVLNKINSGEYGASLSNRDRQAVTAYLIRRYKIKTQ